MARNPVTGHYYPWYRDAVWCSKYGNGEVISVRQDAIVCTFEWWTGTMDRKKIMRYTATVWKENFETWKEVSEFGGYWKLDSDVVV